MTNRKVLIFLLSISLVLLFATTVKADTTNNSVYGSGTYGSCAYGTCNITLASSGTVNLNVTPSYSLSYTVQSDTVSVTTDSSTGYTLSVTDSSTNTAMTNGSNTIAASSGTEASPTTLSANTWGYRLDNLWGFGAGPTSAQSSVGSLSLTFAGLPASNGTAAILVNSGSPADPTVNTSVWYALCVNQSIPASSYSTGVTYTAVTN